MGVLHAKGVIYRDLKPENVLIGNDGYLKITDFGLSKTGLDSQRKGEKTYSFCGTPEYLAPEIIEGIGHDKSVDWWSLGAILYEMLSGMPPHYQKNRKQMLRDIVEKQVPMQSKFSSDAVSLLKSLLERNPSKRLGTGPAGTENMKKHPFFQKINWENLDAKKIKPEVVPYVSGQADCRNIDKMFTNERAKETPADESAMTNTIKKETNFNDWTFENSNQLQGVKGGK